ncbi:site-2 protease family protein [Niveibacterium terrae]|uniref:site-2 protease family protein n=1 Tax=Niveibacterium terrae TaxID=3373598 RepID=UPI003A8FED63
MANVRLPSLREELALLPGSRLKDGQPSWMLHDPVRNQFFQIDWLSFEILSRWSLDDPEAILDALHATTTLRATAADIEGMLVFLQSHQLLQIRPGASRQMAERLRLRKGTFGQWLLHNYLFFRIPLVKPDRWLSRNVKRLDWLFSRSFLFLTLTAAVLGLINVGRSWELFSRSFVDMVSLPGMLGYGLTVTVVKIIHELGHGFAAKHFGCRVPTMGVAFLVMWPVAYTDTNDVWKLTERGQRLKIVAAGIATELAIAAWATLAWGWLPEGGLKTAAFLLSTTTWVGSVLINASPFMRFDGYYLLSDFLGLPNLHDRAFALARWDLRERLFALGEPEPEHFPVARKRFLILFAWLTGIYRLVVFLSIAAIVYHFFIKLVGVLLFMVEIVWFVLRPFINEFRAWSTRWASLRTSRRAMLSAGIALAMLVLSFLPWPTRIRTSGMLQPQEQWPVYAPDHAQVTALPLKNGSPVKAGTLLLEMSSPSLQTRAEQGEARRESLSWQSGAAGIDSEMRKDWQVLNEQLQTAKAELSSIAADASRFEPRAPYDGVFVDLPPELRVGDWLANRELLGRVVRRGKHQVVTYVTGEDIHRIRKGDRGLFFSDGLAGPVARLRVIGVDQDSSRMLAEPELASIFGGDIAVREKNGVFYPEQAIYRVLLTVESGDVSDQHSWRGRVTLEGDWEAPALRFLRSAMSVFWREAGF